MKRSGPSPQGTRHETGMTLRQTLLHTLSGLLGTTPGLVCLHSSLAALAPQSLVRPWDALFALSGLIRQGWTVALPAFTFSFCGGQPFHHQNSPSETGILADWLLEHHPEARRTSHPIYSFAVAGPEAEALVRCPSSTTFGDDSPFGLFEQRDATLVMLGCGWDSATQFHRYEELAGVPYRSYKDFHGRATYDDGAGERETTARMFVRDLALDPANDFRPAVERLRSAGLIRSAPLWRGRVEAVQVGELARASAALLAADPMAFVAGGPQLACRLSHRRRAGEEPPLRVAILGNANCQPLCQALEQTLAQFLPERRLETLAVPFGQVTRELVAADSELKRWRPDFAIFCDRLEDLLGQARLDGQADHARPEGEGLQELVERHAANISLCQASVARWTIVHRFASLGPTADEDGGQATASLVDRLNALLERRLSGPAQVLWVDVAAEAAAEAVPAVDSRLWHLGRIPFSQHFGLRLARHWAGRILACLGKSARALVLDLDNTLWGGVLGEDGLQGLRLGGDHPGNAYLTFQRALKALTRRGIALAVCSKNDEDLALSALDSLEAMQFRSADLSAHRINWLPKWRNIQDIAAELNLGLESLLFVDDNPVEREAVRRHLPGVRVLDLPPDPVDYATALLDSPWLGAAQVTPEDRQRAESYKTRRRLEGLRATSASLEDFYASLGMTLHIQPLAETNLARAVQLCMKTNQFNTTTRRHGQAELLRFIEEGDDVAVLGLEDRHSARENIGLLILRRMPGEQGACLIDSYLLSCRVLGRGLEPVVVEWARHRAYQRGLRAVCGLVEETERNTPARSIFQDAGFRPGEQPGQWMGQTSPTFRPPAWLAVADHYSLSNGATP